MSQTKSNDVNKLPRDASNDYTPQMAQARRTFIAQKTGADLTHVSSYSFDPAVLPGNIENFSGVVQVPLGFAGPLPMRGEFAPVSYTHLRAHET